MTIRYFGLYANAHRRKIKKASLAAFPLRIVEDKLRPIPSRGWAEMIRKVYEVDPLLCPKCGGRMKIIAFITDFSVVDRIINHLKVDFCGGEACPVSGAFERPCGLLARLRQFLTVLDISSSRDLFFHTMVAWENGDEDADLASAAKKQIPMNSPGLGEL